MVFLYGKVDTNTLHSFISSHPDTRFLWAGAGNEIEEGWPSGKEYVTTTWTNIIFRSDVVVDGYEASIQGTVDFHSHIVTIQSIGSDQPVSANK
jgi:hypothetical protein